MPQSPSTIVAVSAVLFISAVAAAGEPQFIDVFRGGEEGYPNYRIPSLVVTKKGTLVAICEGRSRDNDHADNDLVMKRSHDGGKTWSKLTVLRDEGKATCNDPVQVVLESGRILLFYALFPEDAHTDEVVPGYEGKVNRHFMMYSDDDGLTWSAPRDISRQVRRPDARASAHGAGFGVQLRHAPHAGRILFPMWELRGADKQMRAYCAISDDGGQNWKTSEALPDGSKEGQRFNANEWIILEREDGSLLMNARGWNMPPPTFRVRSLSTDGGLHWKPAAVSPQLPEPQCHGSMLRFSSAPTSGKSRILFANPATHMGRKKGTIRLSYDEGETWPVAKELVPGIFRYSCLAILPDQTICCLFEQGPADTPRITLARFSLAWVTDGKDDGK